MALCHYCGLNDYDVDLISCRECNVTFDAAREGVKGPWANGVSTPKKEKTKGLFSSKENWNLETLNPIQAWWATTLEQALGTKFINNLRNELEPVGVFNVEGGTATLTTNPESCDNCVGDSFFVSEVCDVCEGGPRQRVVLAAGTGDGVYGVWQDSGEPADLILVSFVRTTGDAPSQNDALRAIQEAAPLYLGSLDSDGALYVRDSMKGQLSIIVHKEEYEVVAWIGSVIGMPSMDQMFDNIGKMSADLFSECLLPVAVTLTRVQERNFAQDAMQSIKSSKLKPSQIAAALWGDQSRTVQSHMQSADADIAYLSGQFLEDETDNRLVEKKFGHMIFHAITGGRADFGPGMDAFLNGEDAHATFSGACMLMSAGRQKEAFEMMKAASDMGHKLAELFYVRMKRRADAREDLFPIWGIGESNYMTYLAQQIRDTEPELALDLHLMAADRGTANSVSTYTWYCLKRGAYQEAIDMYEATREYCLGKAGRMLQTFQDGDDSIIDELSIQLEQLSNSTINIGVAHIAVGSAEEIILEALSNDENAEAKAYKALYLHRLNRGQEAKSLIESLEKDHRSELTSLCESEIGLVENDLWFNEWFKDLLVLLGE